MPTVQKIQASLYATSKRLQGYRLLKNPIGTSQTEVNMIKEWHGVSEHWDDIFHVTRIRKTFSEEGNHEEKRFLMSTHFMDVDRMEITKPRKKDMNYSVKKDGKYVLFRNKADMSFEDAEKRKVPELSYERSDCFLDDSEYDIACKIKRDAQMNRGYYKKHYSLFDKIVSLGMHETMMYPEENRPNFFRVLYHNLTNKPIEQKYDLRINFKHLV